MTFQEMRLAAPIVRAVEAEGYTTPTPIQARAIPEAMTGRDILGTAQTGTGKTCAFALPILHRLFGAPVKDEPPTTNERRRGKHARQPRKGRPGRAPRALVLCPTRELATQIFQSFVAYGRQLPLRHTVVFGGVNQFRQVKALQGGIDVLVATPGRLLDLMNQGHVDLRSIETLVLDEADRMLDMGFINDIRKVVAKVPRTRQTLFFSATVSKEIRTLSATLLSDPVHIETAPEATTVELIQQRVYKVDRSVKGRLLEHVLQRDEVDRVLVFTRTKHGADRLVKSLRRSNIEAEAIHGNKTQASRTRTMRAFKAGQVRVLIATDIASRGIDVDDISHVINFDMPVDAETYVHRIGRTARAGASGVALSFCDQSEWKLLQEIERRSRIRIEIATDAPSLTATSSNGAGRQSRESSRGGTAARRTSRSAPRTSSVGERRRSHKQAAEETHAEAKPKRRPRKSNAAQWQAKPKSKIAPKSYGKSAGRSSSKAQGGPKAAGKRSRRP